MTALVLDWHFLTQPWVLAATLFQIWMVFDAVRRREWVWVIFLILFHFLTAILYFFLVYRGGSVGAKGFELPGAGSRARIRELERQIHHLDKAHHHLQLGDVYFRKGKWDKAEACYRASLEREADDPDALSHLGQCLLRQGKGEEARRLLQRVCVENPRHEYGHTLMAYAEALAVMGETEAAIEAWRQVLASHSYARARVQLAELLLARGDREGAVQELRETISDDEHAPVFQRRRDRVWVRRAKRLRRAARG